MNIDKYAYISRLKHIDPMLKFTFALLTMSVCLWANSVLISVIIVLIMGWLTVYKGGTPVSLFIKLLMVPMSFLFIGVLTIAVNISKNQNDFLFSLVIAGMHIGVQKTGLYSAARLFFKALGAVSCLYYLSLSTPMVDILAVLRMFRIPKLLIELMGLIYRFIFVLIETADTMTIAQNSRLGYSSLSATYHSMGTLFSTLFIRAYKRGNDLYTALEARGYDGELNVLEEQFDTHWTKYILPVAINLLLVLGTISLRRIIGGFLL